jgi:hypothetical protein
VSLRIRSLRTVSLRIPFWEVAMTEFVPLIFGTVAALAAFLFFSVSEVCESDRQRNPRLNLTDQGYHALAPL